MEWNAKYFNRVSLICLLSKNINSPLLDVVPDSTRLPQSIRSSPQNVNLTFFAEEMICALTRFQAQKSVAKIFTSLKYDLAGDGDTMPKLDGKSLSGKNNAQA
jgi:hypothetical protein